jgi:hypothetical protein
VWLFLENAMEDIENVLACRDEQCWKASSDNILRVVPSIDKLARRVDMIVKLFDLELAVEEGKPNTDSTFLKIEVLKIVKEMFFGGNLVFPL